MKITIQPLALSLALAGICGAAVAQTSDTPPAPGTAPGAPPPAWHHGGEGQGPGDGHGWGHDGERRDRDDRDDPDGGGYGGHGWHHHHWRHRHHHWDPRGGAGWGGRGPGLMGSFRELGLSDAQRQQIRTIWSAERESMQSKGPKAGAREDLAALANPGDPGYAAAVQAAKTRAAERIQRMSDMQLKLYNVLTPQQKAQFTKILADKKARWDQWAAEHKDHGPRGNGPQGGGNPPAPAPAQ